MQSSNSNGKMTFTLHSQSARRPYINRSTVKKRSYSEPLPGAPETVYVSGAPFRPRTIMVFPLEANAVHTNPVSSWSCWRPVSSTH